MTATETKSRPILFSGEMVRAILDGRKTETRRVVKGVDHSPGAGDVEQNDEFDDEWYQWIEGDPSLSFHCPYGQRGDRLWVRETWAVSSIYDDTKPRDVPRCGVRYPATFATKGLKNRPSIFMPRWASRITLEVTGVRVERLQVISNKDVLAEGWLSLAPGESVGDITNETSSPVFGLPSWTSDSFHHGMNPSAWNCSAQQSFRYGWDQINAERGHSWKSNPWVWVVEFKQIGKD